MELIEIYQRIPCVTMTPPAARLLSDRSDEVDDYFVYRLRRRCPHRYVTIECVENTFLEVRLAKNGGGNSCRESPG